MPDLFYVLALFGGVLVLHIIREYLEHKLTLRQALTKVGKQAATETKNLFLALTPWLAETLRGAARGGVWGFKFAIKVVAASLLFLLVLSLFIQVG